MSVPDLDAAAATVSLCAGAIQCCAQKLAEAGGSDAHQVMAYDLAHAAAGVETSRTALEYGARGQVEARMAWAFVSDVAHDLLGKTLGREKQWGLEPGWASAGAEFIAKYRDPSFLAELCGERGPRHLDPEFEMVADSFRRFAEDRIRPVAEHVHRTNADIPEEIISGLAELGAFGLSVPEEYGGFATGGESDYLGMVAATEELSRGSLGVGGSLITRPEILTRAIVRGGTGGQKRDWLSKI